MSPSNRRRSTRRADKYISSKISEQILDKNSVAEQRLAEQKENLRKVAERLRRK